jgi:spore germination protein YaaH
MRLPVGAPLLALALISTEAAAQHPEALWYSTGGDSSTVHFVEHASQVDIVSPQVFQLSAAGRITGHIDPRVVAAARAHLVKLVPLVMNPGFSQPAFHRVLTNRTAWHTAIRALAALCRDQHLDGIQFDLENIHVHDRDRFTAFVREATDSVHRAGCTLSAAVVPRASDDPGTNTYDKWIYDNWRGVYDYKALADTLDFISYMTYAEHTGGSPAGPVAGMPWMVDCLKYLLALGVPPSKISLGIPSYSDWWFPSYTEKQGSRMTGRDIPYVRAESLTAANHVPARWDSVQHSPRAEWSENGVFRYLWVEDARAFMDKLALVSAYHLRGYSVWVLGTEDPALWAALARGGSRSHF